MAKIWLLFLLAIPAWAMAASAPPQVRITDDKGAAVNWPMRAEWKWLKNAESVVVLRAALEITPPASVTNLDRGSQTMHIKKEGQNFVVQTGAVHGHLRVTEGGQTKVYNLEVSPPQPAILQADCKDIGLTVHGDDNLPFFIGARCVPSPNQKMELHLTIPEEGDVDQSSLFEQKGKGESWRVYELGRADSGSSENGRVVIRYGSKSYNLSLTWGRKGKEEQPKIKTGKNFAVGLGYDMLNVTGNTSGSSAQYLLLLKILPNVYWQRLGFGADFGVTFALSQQANAINYLQFAPYVFYRLVQNKYFTLDPRLYFAVASIDQASTGVGSRTSQIGIGLRATYQVSQNWQTYLEAMSESFGSKVIKSHYYIDLGFNRTRLDKKLQWGGGVQMQTFKVQDLTGLTYQFGQTAVYGLLLF